MITAENLICSYGRLKVLKEASLFVDQGECVGIVGANGCGKSTLLAALAGCRKIKKGNILLGGQAGYVPQVNPLVPQLTVMDHLRLWNVDVQRDRMVSLLDLKDILKMQVKNLSGGMQKRVSIACLLANDPDIFLLDEPGCALDMICREVIRETLLHSLGMGRTILLATHEEQELDLCSRIYVMKEGKLWEADKNLRGKSLTALFLNASEHSE